MTKSYLSNWLTILGPTVLTVFGGFIGWFLKSRWEELRAIEERLREKRQNVYFEILEPYIQFISTTKTEDAYDQSATKAIAKLASPEYQRTAFELSLLGSDGVVNAYKKLTMYLWEVYPQKTGSMDKNTAINELAQHLGQLLVEIRKNLGDKRTRLEGEDILPVIGLRN